MRAGDKQVQLPVFCVSARDCHRIEGRLPSESKKATFSTVRNTQLPELRAHVHALTGESCAAEAPSAQPWPAMRQSMAGLHAAGCSRSCQEPVRMHQVLHCRRRLALQPMAVRCNLSTATADQ